MFTTSLATDQDALERVGGKGRSLSKMVREGFNVPIGFIVTADAYRSFIADNGLQTEIVSDAKPQLKDGYPAFDQCAIVIGGKIQQASMDAAIVTAVKTAYAEIQAQQGDAERTRLISLLQKDELQQQLTAYGLDASMAAERVRSMSDAEVEMLNAKLDELPAGEGIVGLAALFFIVFIITDALGATDIFTFVKPIR